MSSRALGRMGPGDRPPAHVLAAAFPKSGRRCSRPPTSAARSVAQRLLGQAEHLKRSGSCGCRLEVLRRGADPAVVEGPLAASTSTRSACPLPETPAMPTISPASPSHEAPSRAGGPSTSLRVEAGQVEHHPSWRRAPCAWRSRVGRLGDHHAPHRPGVGDLADVPAGDVPAATQHGHGVGEPVTSRNLCVIMRTLICPARAICARGPAPRRPRPASAPRSARRGSRSAGRDRAA